jgi:hypothetical protein
MRAVVGDDLAFPPAWSARLAMQTMTNLCLGPGVVATTGGGLESEARLS